MHHKEFEKYEKMKHSERRKKILKVLNIVCWVSLPLMLLEGISVYFLINIMEKKDAQMQVEDIEAILSGANLQDRTITDESISILEEK